jgi:hypothetical protein
MHQSQTERTSRKNDQARDEARADVFGYIERFYNPKRRHSTLGYRSPAASGNETKAITSLRKQKLTLTDSDKYFFSSLTDSVLTCHVLRCNLSTERP